MNRIIMTQQIAINYEIPCFKALAMEGEMPPLNEWLPLSDLTSSHLDVKVINHDVQ